MRDYLRSFTCKCKSISNMKYIVDYHRITNKISSLKDNTIETPRFSFNNPITYPGTDNIVADKTQGRPIILLEQLNFNSSDRRNLSRSPSTRQIKSHRFDQSHKVINNHLNISSHNIATEGAKENTKEVKQSNSTMHTAKTPKPFPRIQSQGNDHINIIRARPSIETRCKRKS